MPIPVIDKIGALRRLAGGGLVKDIATASLYSLADIAVPRLIEAAARPSATIIKRSMLGAIATILHQLNNQCAAAYVALGIILLS